MFQGAVRLEALGTKLALCQRLREGAGWGRGGADKKWNVANYQTVHSIYMYLQLVEIVCSWKQMLPSKHFGKNTTHGPHIDRF